MKNKKIAIIGYASRLPQTSDATFWEDLLAGRNLVTRVAEERWAQYGLEHPSRAHPGSSVTFAAGSLGDVGGFDAGFFRISPREAAAMDPQQRLLLEMSWEAFAHAGIPVLRLRGSRCGVFIGLASTDYGYRLADDLAAIGTNSATGSTASIAANRLSYFYDLQGPSMVVDTACSSALVAFHQACQSLLHGESDLALTGAINLHLHPFGFLIFSKASMLSAEGRSRPFDAAADGYVRAEGGGVFVLKEHAAALRDGDRILAVVAHTAINTDGHKAGLTIPRVAAQAALLTAAYAAAGIDPDAVDYIEAHGTGTAVGDPLEVEAIGRALGARRRADNPLPLGSVKSNLGHMETASGVPGLLKAIHCLQQRIVPATIGVTRLNPRLPLADFGLEVVTAARALRTTGPLTVGVNAFGFGGANAHVILERAAEPRRRLRSPAKMRRSQRWPLLLSAATPTALRQVAADFAGVLTGVAEQDYACRYQANFRSERLGQRALFWGDDGSDLAADVRAFAAGEDAPPAALGKGLETPRGPVFLYSGNGSQWVGMGRALLNEPVFTQTLAAIDAIFLPLAGYALRDELAGLLGEGRYVLTEFAQPALFALQVGITECLRALEIEPVAVAGHSVGEVAAAWACGGLSLADAVRVVYERSRLQGQSRGLGQMTAVAANADTVMGWLQDWDLADRVSIAAWNSPRGSTVVGAQDALTALERRLRNRGVGYKRLDVDYPFHSPQMDGFRAALLDSLADLHPMATRIPLLSTVTGAVLAEETLDATYWWRNIREPVRFQQAVEELLQSWNIFIELGGHPVLRGYVQDALNAAEQDGRIITTLRRGEENAQVLTQAAAALWVAGVATDWQHYYPVPAPVVDLPRYPWEREHHWHTVTSESARTLTAYPVHPLLGHPLAGHAGEWEQQIDTARLPFLADHRVGDGIIFPGAGYVELLLAAARERFGSSAHLVIEDLEIVAPLLLDDDDSKVLRVSVDEGGVATIQARPLLQEGWTLHGKGRIRQGNAGAGPDTLQECSTPPSRLPDFDADRHYRLADMAGLHYGPAFQSVQAGWLQEDGVLARLALPAPADATDYLLHPVLLDGALQLFVNLLAAEGTAQAGWGYVPVRVERLSLLAAAEGVLWASVRLLRRSPQSLLADLSLTDGQGRVVVRCEGVRLRRVRLLRSDVEHLRYLHSRLTPVPLAQCADARISLDLAAIHTLLADALADSTAAARYIEEFSPLVEGLLQAYGAESATVSGEEIAAADIWQTLLQDYPEFFPITLQVGRWGLHRSGSGESGTWPQIAIAAYPAILQTMTPPMMAGMSALVAALRMELSAGQRLGILEISHSAAEWLPTLAAGVGEDVRCALYQAGLNDAEASLTAPWTTIHLRDENRPVVHLAWLRLDVADKDLQLQMLDCAVDCVAAEGVLLVQGVHPELWWRTIDEHDPSLMGMAECRQWLEDRGFAGCRVLGAEEAGTGAYALLLRKAAAVAVPESRSPAGCWLLVGTPGAENVPGVVMLRTALTAAGAECHFIVADSDALLTAALAENAGDKHWAGVVYLERPALTTPFSPATLSRSCQILRALGLWGVSQTAVAPVFVLTAGGVRATCPLADEQSVDLAALDAAGLCGFARSLQNEWPEWALRLIDWGTTSPTAATVVAVVGALLDPDAETELVFDAEGRRYAPRVQELTSPAVADPMQASSCRQLGFSLPGQLRNLQWADHPCPALADDAVEVVVAAAGLNFRDVMYALGMLSDEALENGFSGPGLGLEFAGRIVAVGRQVTRWAPGDAVLGFAPASFSTHVQTSETAIAALPPGMDMAAAVTIPTVFFTAWYALRELARLEAGERVLIHGGAGGVGIAAIQIAQQLGAEVFATAGSPEKRDFLRLLGVNRVYDSRSLDFAEAILRDTGGTGVDVLLNSLSGEAIRRNLQVLRPFGRFLELGKRDFYENTAMGLRPFRNNLSYFGIDADQLLLARPALTQRLFTEIMEHFAQGDFFTLPVIRFPAARVVEAFRHMQQARQIGKIVVDMEAPFTPAARPSRQSGPGLRLSADGVYLVTGGLSGFGLETARWLVTRGARRLVLISRSARPDASGQEALMAMTAAGVDLHCLPCDVGDGAQVQALFARIAAEIGPLRGIIHAAAVIDDALAQNLTATQIDAVLRPKIAGAWHLHQNSQSAPLDFFVLYSSVTTLLGNPGQAHYVAANTWMEALATQRRAQGLPATAVLWGAIGDVGYLARNPQTRDVLQQRLGGATLRAATALNVLESMLLTHASALVVADLDWGAVRRFLPGAQAPRFTELSREVEDAADATDADLCATLQTLPLGEAQALLTELVRREVGQILRLAVEKIPPDQNLGQLGLDSLMGIELALALEERLGIKLPAFLLSEGPTPGKLAQRLLQTLRKRDTADAALAEQTPDAEFQRLAAAHGVVQQEVDAALRTGTGGH
ncbi:type I polyketide synthase [Acidithiobacillus ferrivorans]|uniref:Type I polyketide synthase n=1 Tax=Acidithiobacillus ferrivorans TaxID=160808 RepID=A0A7T4WER6_9PROT|nr:type I polyketide synthase [Acidithiobacillus ferrivorans]QQD73257.1 type I polyketide synthase [Acidithiobacillus ferrivorans]